MFSGFIIGKDIFFDTDSFQIHHITQGEITNLAGVKGRCLLCLLTNRDQEVTTKKTLFSDVWEKFGLYANDNSLLQVIYTLRKELKDINLANLILTQPRLGYTINPSWSVHKASHEEVVEWFEKRTTPAPLQENTPEHAPCEQTENNTTAGLINRLFRAPRLKCVKIHLLCAIVFVSILLAQSQLHLFSTPPLTETSWLTVDMLHGIIKMRLKCHCITLDNSQDRDDFKQCACKKITLPIKNNSS